MIQELREYIFEKEKWPAYWSLFNEICLPTRKNDYGVLKGLWLHEGEDEVRFFHLWQYASLNDRARLRVRLAAIPVWKNDFLPRAAATLTDQFIRILNPHQELNEEASGSAQSLAVYDCIPGQAGAFIHFLKRGGLTALSLWQSEFGNPNEVILLRDGLAESDNEQYEKFVKNYSLLKVKILQPM
ncbi:NIPSNAP family protein [Acerihabitans sp. KWT182]|uniref:NIPSNAP family protein n=1 Tax=Acerihabitans sp. KWT182 TaxID=3157919 RepID=A0AAU7QB14_9GAMM